MKPYTKGNGDNINEAVRGLDIFTKNWCMNVAETEKQKDLIFRCDECAFDTEDNICLVKKFANEHYHEYPMNKFGSMGAL